MADEWIETVRRATDLAEVASRHLTLRRRGHKWVGLCPFHDEKSPSFQIDPDKQLFYCFGCHAGGDVFRLLEKLEHKSFGEVVRSLALDAGLTPPERGTADERDRRELFRQAMHFSESLYRKTLAASEGQEARHYLLEKRRLTEETIGRFGLGWAAAASPLTAATGGRDKPGQGASTGPSRFREILELAGMIKKGSGASEGRFGDLFRSRVMIPIREKEGAAPLGFGGRTIDPGSPFPKYLNSAESPYFRKRDILFGIDQAMEPMKRTGRVLLVEGYFDAMRLNQSGIGEVVAPLGTSLGPAHISLVKKHVQEVILLFDGDRAGRDAAIKVIGRFLWDPDLLFRAVWLPDGMDPDQWVETFGADSVRKTLDRALPMGDFVLDWLGSRVLDLKAHPDGAAKGEVVESFLSMIRSFPDLEVQERLLEKGSLLLETMKDLLAMKLLGETSAKDPQAERQGSAALTNRDLRWRNVLAELARLWIDNERPHPREIFSRRDFSFIADATLSNILDTLWSRDEVGPADLQDLLKTDPFLWKQWCELPRDPDSRALRLSDVRTMIERLTRHAGRPKRRLSARTEPVSSSSANKGV